MKILVAYLTGQSVPGCSGLSRVQRDFLKASVVPEGGACGWNFPWRETEPFPDKLGLAGASWSNVRQCLASFGGGYRERHRDQAIAFLAGAERIVLLAGSCGSELLNNLDLPDEVRRRLHVFAYGPVSRRRPEVSSSLLVQGSRDWISRSFHRRVDRIVPCGHMDYLSTPETLSTFNAFYREVAAP